MTTSTLREVFCATLGCKMQRKPIAYTDGHAGRFYCGACREWVWWRA